MFTMLKRVSETEEIPELPEGYNLVQWSSRHNAAFAAVLRVAYIKSPELLYYPVLKTSSGCRHFVEELTGMHGFVPENTWLVEYNNEPCAVIITNRGPGNVFGEIQVVAVVPRHRRMGLGKFLVSRAVKVFKNIGIPHAILNLNRSNRGSIRFFRRNGFQVSSSGVYAA